MPDYSFGGDTAVVTGGASGIGRRTALEFARNGAAVVVADVDEDGAEAVVAAAEEVGSEAVAVRADVTDLADMERMVETAVEAFGGLDYAVNNAGIGGSETPAGDLDEATWQGTIDINLNGVWRSLRAELDRMVEQERGGAIVNMSSVLGQVGFESAAAYVAAKHGVLGLTRTAAWEYADEGVRVNAVCPGFVETSMLESAGIHEDDPLRARVEAMHSQHRLGDPSEVAAAVLWLCSDAASFTNGEALTVDSGYTAV